MTLMSGLVGGRWTEKDRRKECCFAVEDERIQQSVQMQRSVLMSTSASTPTFESEGCSFWAHQWPNTAKTIQSLYTVCITDCMDNFSVWETSTPQEREKKTFQFSCSLNNKVS